MLKVAGACEPKASKLSEELRKQISFIFKWMVQPLLLFSCMWGFCKVALELFGFYFKFFLIPVISSEA